MFSPFLNNTDDAPDDLDQVITPDSSSQPADTRIEVPSSPCVESTMPVNDNLEDIQDEPHAPDTVESVQTDTIGSRKTTRTCKPPEWIKDYVVPKKSSPHSITNHVCYDNVSTCYQSYLHAF